MPDLHKIISDRLGVNLDRVTDEAHLVDDLEADSLDLVELAMSLEETYGIMFQPDDWKSFQRVSDVSRLVENADRVV